MEKGRPDECWPWTGGKQGKGYGQFFLPGGKPIGAHRYSWMLANGQEIPAGMHVLHSCDNPPCVNPAHLRVGWPRDNSRDAIERGRNLGNRTARGGHTPRWSPEVIAAMRHQGLTYRDIGEVLDIAPSTALRAHRKLQ